MLPFGALKHACALTDGSNWRVSDSHCRILENIRKVVSDYEKRLQEMPFVPRFSYGLGFLEDGEPNRIFLTYLFSEQALAKLFLPYLGISAITYGPEE